MKKRNNELKMLANLAKHRLLSADYSNTKDISSHSGVTKPSASSYFIKNAKAMRRLKADTEYVTITDGSDDAFIKSVVTLLSSDSDVYNPLAKLCDQKYFNNLGDAEKQSYILKLSDKYTRVKTMFDNHELDALKIS